MQNLSSPIRDQTHAPSNGSQVSPLDHQGSPQSHLSKVTLPHPKTSMAPQCLLEKGHVPQPSFEISEIPSQPPSPALYLLLVTQICSTPSLPSLLSAVEPLCPTLFTSQLTSSATSPCLCLLLKFLQCRTEKYKERTSHPGVKFQSRLCK